MSKADLHQRLSKVSEITLSVKDRNHAEMSLGQSGLYMKATLCICFQSKAHTNWYKNLLLDPMLKISVNDVETPARGKLITDSNRVGDIVRKFNSKYSEGEVKKYYTKFDVAVEVQL